MWPRRQGTTFQENNKRKEAVIRLEVSSRSSPGQRQNTRAGRPALAGDSLGRSLGLSQPDLGSDSVQVQVRFGSNVTGSEAERN